MANKLLGGRWKSDVGQEGKEKRRKDKGGIATQHRYTGTSCSSGTVGYLRGALHNLAACTSHKLEVRLKRGDYNFISGGYISELNPDETLKIVVQPIAFKEEHLPVPVAPFRSLPYPLPTPPLFPPRTVQTSRLFRRPTRIPPIDVPP